MLEPCREIGVYIRMSSSEYDPMRSGILQAVAVGEKRPKGRLGPDPGAYYV